MPVRPKYSTLEELRDRALKMFENCKIDPKKSFKDSSTKLKGNFDDLRMNLKLNYSGNT